jgi:hypothetical protein
MHAFGTGCMKGLSVLGSRMFSFAICPVLVCCTAFLISAITHMLVYQSLGKQFGHTKTQHYMLDSYANIHTREHTHPHAR